VLSIAVNEGVCNEHMSEKTAAESMLERIRTLVAARSDLADILVQQASNLPERVFGSTSLTASEFLEIYIDEARYLLDLVRAHLKKGLRILEVGGGLGLFHLMAYAEGADITSMEPSEGGFSYFRTLGLSLITQLTGRPHRFVDGRGEDLPWGANEFDLVVSNNVLEHVSDPRRVLQEMYRVTVPGGILLHSCPNYLFPYEPHYKVPVIPCAVGFSGRVCWRAFQTDPLWRSLNSINVMTVMHAVHAMPGARLVFRNAMRHIVKRLANDAYLGKRHGTLARFVLMPPVRALLMVLPPQLLTPMVFEITKLRA